MSNLIRAVDEAGAVEPTLEFTENWIKFHIQDTPSQPSVTITERSLGRHTYPQDGPVWNVEVPSDTPIRLKWTGDAQHYGSKPGNVNYGLDVPDPQDDRYRDPRGIGGWIGWGKYTQLVTPLVFPVTEAGQQHVFYLRMRDAGDLRSSERLCTIVMTVVAFTFSIEMLVYYVAWLSVDSDPPDQHDVSSTDSRPGQGLHRRPADARSLYGAALSRRKSQPRQRDQAERAVAAAVFSRSFRIVNDQDLVPRAPEELRGSGR
jgi:hypothetical protein